MVILVWFGWVVLVLISFSLISGGALNLAGAGDRFEKKYRKVNIFQICIGLALSVVCYYTLPT